MEDYIAFISYRHRPLDQTVAIHLHRMIEHFIIPGDLRAEHGRRLGKVFRDEDELPLSADLGDSIRTALAHSRFLICICTPEYLESRWCMAELNAFIAMHGQERVLAVLAEGRPEDSFPKQLLYTSDENGNQKFREPLAANITALTKGRRMQKLKTEKYRLIAAMLNVPFDNLYQREKRYRQQRRMVAAVTALALAAAFIGVLITKNREIQTQYEESLHNLRQALLNESVARTENARRYRSLGRRTDALSSLLEALPDDPDQPFDPDIEAELAESLAVYASEGWRFSANLQQPTEITAWILSESGNQVFTWDPFGTVRAYSGISGRMLWNCQLPETTSLKWENALQWCGESRGILCCAESASEVFMVSADDGTLRWSVHPERWSGIAAAVSLPSGRILMMSMAEKETLSLMTIDELTGQTLEQRELPVAQESGMSPEALQLSPDGRYAAAVAKNILNSPATWTVLLINLETLQATEIPLTQGSLLETDVRISFLPDGQVMAASVLKSSTAISVLLQRINPASGETVTVAEAGADISDAMLPECCLSCSSEYALFSCGRILFLFSLGEEKLVQTAAMPGNVLSLEKLSRRANAGVFACSLDNGLFSFLLADRDGIMLTSDYDRLFFDAAFSFRKSRIQPFLEMVTVLPKGRADELLIIRKEGTVPVDPGHPAAQKFAAVSPSGQRIWMRSGNEMAVFSAEDGQVMMESPYDTAVMPFGNIRGNQAVFTSDEERIILETWECSVASGETARLRLTGDPVADRTASCWVPALGKAVTAVLVRDPGQNTFYDSKFHLLLDGEDTKEVALPDGIGISPLSAEGLWQIDGSGLLLMTGISGSERIPLLIYDVTASDWCIFPGAEELSVSGKAASGSQRKLLAVLDQQELTVYEAGRSEPLWTAGFSCPSETVSGLWFSPDDQLLLAAYADQRIALYRTADGRLLNDLAFRTFGSSLSMQMDAEGRLFVYCSPALLSSGWNGLILDGTGGQLLADVPEMVFVNLRTKQIYRWDTNYKKTVQIPLYSFRELQEQAERILAE